MLVRAGAERYADLVGIAGGAGDESVADLLRDAAHAEVARDIGEVRDIVAAENRIAAGSYGVCIDCGAFIGQPRLTVYPAAKRCFRCQQILENYRAINNAIKAVRIANPQIDTVRFARRLNALYICYRP